MDLGAQRSLKKNRGQKKNSRKRSSNRCLKVVYISSPMKVTTTASDFRSIVQKLTGRHSDVAQFMETTTIDPYQPTNNHICVDPTTTYFNYHPGEGESSMAINCFDYFLNEYESSPALTACSNYCHDESSPENSETLQEFLDSVTFDASLFASIL